MADLMTTTISPGLVPLKLHHHHHEILAQMAGGYPHMAAVPRCPTGADGNSNLWVVWGGPARGLERV